MTFIIVILVTDVYEHIFKLYTNECVYTRVWITGTTTFLFSVKNVPNAFPLWGLMRKLDNKCEYDFVILFYRDVYVQFAKIGERYSREICSSFTLNAKYWKKM